jgi:TolB-like protein
LKRLTPRSWRNAFFKCLFAMTVTLVMTAAPAGAENVKKIVILPLTINSDQDLAFLQRGLQNMLISRLTVPGRLMPVESQKVTDALAGEPSVSAQTSLPPSRAIELARTLGADYAVVGSLTVFGDTISTDAQVFNVASGTPQVSFHQVGASQSDVIHHVDAFSAKVNQALLGIRPPASTATATAAASAAAVPADSSAAAETPNPRRHPEALLETSPQPVPAADTPVARVPGEPWISRAFKTEIHGVAVGDVDGDGANEVVVAEAHAITVHRFTQGRLVRVTKVEEHSRNAFLNVDVADINANGKAEIFVTNLPAGSDNLRSFVLEWKDDGLTPIVEKQNWFYHVTAGPDGKTTL